MSAWSDELGVRLAEARKRASLTLAAVGEAVDANQQTVHRWERGQQIPSAEYVARLCRLYRVSADVMLGLRQARRT